MDGWLELSPSYLYYNFDASILLYWSLVAPVQYADVRRYSDGKSKGYGVVDFEIPEDAEKAIKELQGAHFMGREITLRFVSNIVLIMYPFA